MGRRIGRFPPHPFHTSTFTFPSTPCILLCIWHSEFDSLIIQHLGQGFRFSYFILFCSCHLDCNLTRGVILISFFVGLLIYLLIDVRTQPAILVGWLAGWLVGFFSSLTPDTYPGPRYQITYEHDFDIHIVSFELVLQ